MKKLILGILVIASLSVSAYATIGFLKGEQTSGLNKICYYDVIGSTFTLNIKSYELCPLTYEF